MKTRLAMNRVRPIGEATVMRSAGRGWSKRVMKVYPETDFDLCRWRHEHGRMSIEECAERLGIRPADVRSLEKGSKRPAESWDAVVKLLRRKAT